MAFFSLEIHTRKNGCGTGDVEELLMLKRKKFLEALLGYAPTLNDGLYLVVHQPMLVRQPL